MAQVYPRTGRRLRMTIAACHVPVGIAVMIAILVALDMGPGEAWEGLIMVGCAAIGAAVGGYLFAGFYGHCRDATDWAAALLGALLATVAGSFFGGALLPFTFVFQNIMGSYPGLLLLAPFRGGALGVMVVMDFAPAEYPALVPFWAVLMFLVQIAAISVRARS